MRLPFVRSGVAVLTVVMAVLVPLTAQQRPPAISAEQLLAGAGLQGTWLMF